MARLQRWERKGEGIGVRELRDEFTRVMEEHAGVFRTEAIMAEGVEQITPPCSIPRASRPWNWRT